MVRLHLFKAPVRSIPKPDESDPLRRWSVVFAGSVALHALLALGAGMINRPVPLPQATLIPIDLVGDSAINRSGEAISTLSSEAPALPVPQSSQPVSQSLSDITSLPTNSGVSIAESPEPAVPAIVSSQPAPVPASPPNSFSPPTPLPLSPSSQPPLPNPQPPLPNPQPPTPAPAPQSDTTQPTLYAVRVSIGPPSLRDVAEQGAKPKTLRQEFTAGNGTACARTSTSGTHFGQPVGLMITVDDRGRVVAGDTVVQEPVDKGEYDRLAMCVVNAWEFEPASNGGSAVWSNVLVRVTVDGL